ncbi:MAG: hypothetical protein ABS944_04465 [Solibacillus sp.]|uniref:hypothetical protein n=1 Tax=Solibacillus sp. TaxID=1909654 RepID=UPI0033161926
MKKITFILLIGLITIVSGCKETQPLDEIEIKNFIMEYKSLIYNVNYKALPKYKELEEKLRPLISEDIFEQNKKNGIYMLPSSFASENNSNIKLEDIEVTGVTYSKGEKKYEVKYALFLIIDNVSYVKKGRMHLISKEKNILITYDWETPIDVGSKNFN